MSSTYEAIRIDIAEGLLHVTAFDAALADIIIEANHPFEKTEIDTLKDEIADDHNTDSRLSLLANAEISPISVEEPGNRVFIGLNGIEFDESVIKFGIAITEYVMASRGVHTAIFEAEDTDERYLVRPKDGGQTETTDEAR